MQSAAELISSETNSTSRGLLEWESVPPESQDGWGGTFISGGAIMAPGDYRLVLLDGQRAQIVVTHAGTTVAIKGYGRPPA